MATKTKAKRRPVTGTTKRKKYNPEKRTWRGHSHRKGERVVEMKAAAVEAKPVEDAKAPCENCREMVSVKEFTCFGCKKVICDKCDDPVDAPWGEHSLDDHRLNQSRYRPRAR